MDENIKTQSFVRWKRAGTRDETKDEKWNKWIQQPLTMNNTLPDLEQMVKCRGGLTL